MANSEEYRKQLDLLFQEIEEKTKLLEQATAERRAEFIAGIIHDKDISKYLRSLPPETRIKLIEGLLRAAFPED